MPLLTKSDVGTDVHPGLKGPTDPTAGAHTHSAATMVPDQSRAERTTSYAVADFPVPHGREEDWRFTPVAELADLFRDERTGLCLDWAEQLPEGVTLSTMSVADWQASGAPKPGDRAAVVAAAHSGGVGVIDIPAEAELTEPVRITLSGDDGQLVHGHLLVRVGRAQPLRSRVLLRGAHPAGRRRGGRHLRDAAGVGRRGDPPGPARCRRRPGRHRAPHRHHPRRAHRPAQHQHLVRRTRRLLRGARGLLRRRRPAPRAPALRRPRRPALPEQCPAAEGTDPYELNRNLILTDGARADSVPNLEIETGEIAGAGHASATGRFDDLQLFYLMSRGIAEEDARRMVVRGFFASVVARIGVPEVEERLMAAIDAELEGAVK